MDRDEVLRLVDAGDTRGLISIAVRAYTAKYHNLTPRASSVVFDFGRGVPPEVLLILPPTGPVAPPESADASARTPQEGTV